MLWNTKQIFIANALFNSQSTRSFLRDTPQKTDIDWLSPPSDTDLVTSWRQVVFFSPFFFCMKLFSLSVPLIWFFLHPVEVQVSFVKSGSFSLECVTDGECVSRLSEGSRQSFSCPRQLRRFITCDQNMEARQGRETGGERQLRETALQAHLYLQRKPNVLPGRMEKVLT